MAPADRGSRRNGLASPARCIVRENRDYTSIVRLFVMHNSRSGSLTIKIGCRNSLTPGDLKNHRICLLSVNYTGAVKFFIAPRIVLYTRIMHIKFGFLTHRFAGINSPNRFFEGRFFDYCLCHVTNTLCHMTLVKLFSND